ncbi:MAG: Ig-like domain repeat protein [Rudaea sp.]|uniref:Ig-like domain repeat protein n=1 Tax=unclassified Rudaea TaxID=2627037 RepID=UPI0010F6BF9E|nr:MULTISPECIES: Ig-like domain repeat protein [unclassified Rudaea]MBN8886712.1 Ig-like domain repeat protein [Rudaea sp.]
MNLRIRRMLRSAAITLVAFCPLAATAAPAAYIANFGDNTVSVVDLSSFAVTNTIAVGAGPQSVAIHPSRPRVYVSNYNDGTVSVIDTQLNTVVDTISLTALSIHPWSVVVDPSGGHLYVGLDGGPSANPQPLVATIDTTTNLSSTFLPNRTAVRGFAFSQDGAHLLLTRNVFNIVESATVPSGSGGNWTNQQEPGAFGIAVDANNQAFWVDHNCNGIDTCGSIRTKAAGAGLGASTPLLTNETHPTSIAADASSLYWTTNDNPGTVRTMIKTGGAATSLTTGLNTPQAIALDSNYVYVTESGNNRLVRIAKTGGTPTYLTVGTTPNSFGNFIGNNAGFADSSNITIGANPAASSYGQPVVLTATIAPGFSGGTVNFCDGGPANDARFCSGGTPLCGGPVNVSGNTATCTTSTLALGTHAITARYNGAGFTSTTPSAATEQVAATATTTALTSDANPSVFGQTVTFTASVSANAPGTGTPSGTVTFLDGTTTLASVTLNSGGQAAFSIGSLGVGSHSISASYSGDTNFSAGTSAALNQVVNQAGTTTTLASSVNPSAPGQTVTLTATVNVNAPGAGTPSGTVTFLDGTTVLASVTLNAGGQATFSTGALSAGSHAITASYSGSTNFSASSSSTLTQVVNHAASTMTLSSGSNPSTFGQAVTFTATVSGSSGPSTPTGTVTFVDGTTTLGTGALNSSGQAVFSTSTLHAGSHTISASYPGDANFAASSGTLTQSVNPATTSVVLSSSSNPSTFGQAVTFGVSVNAGQAPTFARTVGAQAMPAAKMGLALASATGMLTILDGTTTLTTVALDSNGQASYSTSALVVGTHAITVNYSGDSNNAPSSASINQVVNSAVVGTPAVAAPAANSALLGLLALLLAATAIGALRRPGN